MVNWVRTGSDIAVGGGAGVIDQLVQNEDEKRKEEDPTLSRWGEYGTYYNYGIPIIAVIATAVGWLKGDMASRFVTAGATLAGRKATYQITEGGGGAVARSSFQRRRRTAVPTGARPQLVAPGGTIPVVSEEAILV